MTHALLQQVLQALEAALSDDQPYIERCKAAVVALRKTLATPEPVAARCPDCIGSERPGWKRGMRCATCDGSATVAAPPAAPEPEPVAYLVEGWHNGKLIAHIPHLTLEDAKASAAVFSQHYTTTKLVPLYAAPPAAPAPVPDGWVMVPREPTPEMLAVVRNGPMCETWAAGYHAMIAAAPPAAPAVPLTDEQLAKIAVEDEFLLYCDQDSFNEIARAIELAHGIGTTGGGK
jgi:hypothetical protein